MTSVNVVVLPGAQGRARGARPSQAQGGPPEGGVASGWRGFEG